MGLAAVAERPAIGTRFDPLDAAYLDDPYPYLAEAREAAPVFYADSIAHWIVTRHRDIKQIFREPPPRFTNHAMAGMHPCTIGLTPQALFARSRKTNFWILPVEVFGKSPKTTWRGTL